MIKKEKHRHRKWEKRFIDPTILGHLAIQEKTKNDFVPLSQPSSRGLKRTGGDFHP